MENYQNPTEEYENQSYESEEISSYSSEFPSAADPWELKKKKKKVFLEGYIDEEDSSENGGGLVSRTMSLTDEDLDELKGCVDLGFGFSYEEIPELCNTLPALELCYSMSQRFMDEHNNKGNDNGGGSVTGSPARTSSMNGSESSYSPSASSAPIANWKISSPGDHPEEVKARLKFWAQAVACTVKLCS